MAFRADESKRSNEESALQYLIPKGLRGSEREQRKEFVLDLIDTYGPVVDTYPSWHPLVADNDDDYCPVIYPSSECGYSGLDHTVCFASGFVTCPYTEEKQNKVLTSVGALRPNPAASIAAEKLDVELYAAGTFPVLVKCEWYKPLLLDGTIPKSLAIPLLLEKELHCWRHSDVAETWEIMRPYFLGKPNGARSSLFINQETGQVIKTIWNALINTGMYGPIKV